MLLKKDIKINSSLFIMIYSTFTALIYNFSFYAKVYEINSSILFVIGTFLTLIILLAFFCNLLFWPFTTKPFAILFILINSVVAYFMAAYKISIDNVMLLNVLETDIAEVNDLLGINIFVYILFLGIIPSIVIYKTKIVFKNSLRLVLTKLSHIVILIVLLVAIILPNYKNVSQFVRNNRSLKYSIIPVNYAAAAVSIIKGKLKQNRKLNKIGEDAEVVPYWKETDKKNLFVFVVGETARAQNFSLGSYSRNTNVPLERYSPDILYQDISSCGTATAISVPCMFSKFGRKNFKSGSGQYNENVLDILQRAGYKVVWYENNSGCKGNCRRIETIEVCETTAGCRDKKMTEIFSENLKNLDKDAFVVLHQLGSHGPTYYKRYPQELEIYKPSCRTEQLNKCSREEVINTYDNTIYYSSRNLAETIEELENVSDRFNTVLLYVSDHGESLGEKGLYLHGAPYVIAPDEQTTVPFFIWMNDKTAGSLNIDKNCLKEKLSGPNSHDNIFHSILGLTGTQTKERNPDLDIFEGCIRNDQKI